MRTYLTTRSRKLDVKRAIGPRLCRHPSLAARDNIDVGNHVRSGVGHDTLEDIDQPTHEIESVQDPLVDAWVN